VRITNLLKSKLAGLLIVALCASLAAPALAAAQQLEPTRHQYRNQLSQISAGADDPADSGRVGGLPFTGFDVIAMSAVALAVAGIGLALQRAVSREPDELT
jgi:hypothetical protein